jgi:hypothetical protein
MTFSLIRLLKITKEERKTRIKETIVMVKIKIESGCLTVYITITEPPNIIKN